MELNVNSIHARIFRWVLFVQKDKMPKTLCPYFWKSVLMWLFIIPIVIVTVPARIANWKQISFGERIFRSVGLYVLMFVGYCMGFFIYCLFADVTKEFLKAHDAFLAAGIVGWVASIILGLAFAYFSITEYLDKKSFEKYGYNKPEKKNVIVESVKGFYNKYCPVIEWKE